jgi:hypothetical protein
MNFALLMIIFVAMSFNVYARGGGAFHGGMEDGGFHEDGGLHEDGGEGRRPEEFGSTDDDLDIADFDGGYNDRDDNQLRGVPDPSADRVAEDEDGGDYRAAIAGPNGYRNGYIWHDGGYEAVNCDPYVPYIAPFGAWAGWSVVTQPKYLNYPVYASYPIETAVQVALQNLGLYEGPVDGDIQSCIQALEAYEAQNGLEITGTVTPELLSSLGIQVAQ